MNINLYPEWPHRQCVGLTFRRSHDRCSLSAASLVICSPARIAVCNTWSSGGTALCRVGGATGQLDLPSLTPLSVAGCGRLQLGVPHWAASVDYCKWLIIDPTFCGSGFSTGRLLTIEDFNFTLLISIHYCNLNILSKKYVCVYIYIYLLFRRLIIFRHNSFFIIYLYYNIWHNRLCEGNDKGPIF